MQYTSSFLYVLNIFAFLKHNNLQHKTDQGEHSLTQDPLKMSVFDGHYT